MWRSGVCTEKAERTDGVLTYGTVMRSGRSVRVLIGAALALLAWLAHSAVHAMAPQDRSDPLSAPAAARAGRPVITAQAAGAGQAGYVHYFLLRMPDETLEIQVGIELPDQRIAWSFPNLGVVVSPFMESGVVPAGGKEYEVWHLYGIRPFHDEAAMGALRREILGRVNPWVEARTPYCEDDGPRRNCTSCLGFVLRVLFPGPKNDYPQLPHAFLRAGTAWRYTTGDLLLYLTGMLDLRTREARLQRIAGLALPEDLREDLEELVYSMRAVESAAPADAAVAPGSVRKRPRPRPSRIGARAAQRRRL